MCNVKCIRDCTVDNTGLAFEVGYFVASHHADKIWLLIKWAEHGNLADC